MQKHSSQIKFIVMICVHRRCDFFEKKLYAFLFYHPPNQEVDIYGMFLVPAAEAVITTIAAKAMKSRKGRNHENFFHRWSC